MVGFARFTTLTTNNHCEYIENVVLYLKKYALKIPVLV